MADDSLPAGMRNNNPLNIIYTPNSGYEGVVGPSQNLDAGYPQLVFETPQHGMNAAAELLLRKYNSGLTSANSIIAGRNGWTPGNSQAAANVAQIAGVHPDEDLNLRDPQRFASFMRALARQEQGGASSAYGPDMYAAAARRALGNKATMYDPFSGAYVPDINTEGAYATVASTAQPPAPPELALSPTAGMFALTPYLSQSMAAKPTIPAQVSGIAAAAPAQRPGFFGALNSAMNDPNIHYWMSILGSGLAGKDFGTASQAAAAALKNQVEMQRIRDWARLWGAQEVSPQAGIGATQQPQAAPGPQGGSLAPGTGPGIGTPTQPGFVPRAVARVAAAAGPDEGSKILANFVTHPHYQSNEMGMFDTHTGQYVHLFPKDETNVVLPSGVSRKQGEEATAIMDQTDRVLANTKLLREALGDTGQVDEYGNPIIRPSIGMQHAIGPQPDSEWWQMLKGSVRGALDWGTPSQDARNVIQQYASQIQNYLQKLEGVGGNVTDAKLTSRGCPMAIRETGRSLRGSINRRARLAPPMPRRRRAPACLASEATRTTTPCSRASSISTRMAMSGRSPRLQGGRFSSAFRTIRRTIRPIWTRAIGLSDGLAG